MPVLHIQTSPRCDESNSRLLSDYLVAQLNDSDTIIRDLAAQPLPAMSADNLVALHGSQPRADAQFSEHKLLSEKLISELKACDTLVIGMPVHNFSVPLVLKQWIDYVCRAGLTFRYTENGPQGLTGIKRAILVVASGGTPIGSSIDFASGYMRHICNFIGVEEVHIVDASGSKGARDLIIGQGKMAIDALVAQLMTSVEV